MKALSFLEMETALKNRFPNINVACNSEYFKDYPKNLDFWVKDSDELTYTAKDLNPLYLANDYLNKAYEINIYKKFAKWCENRGYFVSSENNTLQIFKS